MNKERNYFPGANSYKGFFSYFNNILLPNRENHTVCIKGGPGTGKSTFMKKIGHDFLKKNFTIEFHHCSSDSESLDAIVVKELNLSILDGTAPHLTDPIYPGVIDTIFNIGDYWDATLLSKNTSSICSLTDQIGFNFKKFYNYLGAAKLILENIRLLNNTCVNKTKLISLFNSLRDEIFTDSIGICGSTRDLFITAIAPLGIISYSQELIKISSKSYILSGEFGSGKNFILKLLVNEAVSRGYSVEIYHNPLIPEVIEHIFIVELKISIMSSSDLSAETYKGYEVSLTDLQKSDRLKNLSNELYENHCEFDCLLKISLEMIANNKLLHDKLESFYIEAMSFDKLNESYDLLTKVLKSDH